MLAAKRSFGNLRLASRSAHQGSVPVLPASASSNRGLVSAVLLSRDSFARKTVKQLQEELGERGLSTKGKKNILVDRLLESVSRGPGRAQQASSTSSFSTTTTASAAVRDAATHDAAKDSGTATSSSSSSSSSVLSGEVSTHSPSPVTTGSAPPTAGESPEATGKITASPGLVVDVKEVEQMEEVAEQAPGGGIDMPQAVFLPGLEAAEGQQAELMIPTSPDKYQNPPDHDPFHQPFVMHPSWLSMSGSDIVGVHQGQPNKPTDDPETRSSEPRPEFQYMPDTTFIQEIASSIGLQIQSKVRSTAKSASAQSSSILQALEAETGVKIPPMSAAIQSLGSGSGKGEEQKFHFQDRDLNQDEKNGLYVLAGLVGGGLLLGNLGSKKTGEDHHDEKKDKEAKH